jgi:hypothetical protein
MSADGSRAQPHWNESAADIAALEHEVQLLFEIRDGLASHSGREMMVDAVTGLIDERQADLERARRPLL